MKYLAVIHLRALIVRRAEVEQTKVQEGTLQKAIDGL
jgi:hypothetical protein